MEPEVNEPRFRILGRTPAGRHQYVVFTVRTGEIRIISAWPMHRKKKQVMSKRYVKNVKGYEKTSTFDKKKIAEAMKRLKAKKWHRLQLSTSAAWDPDLVAEIKVAAEEWSVPYQVMLSMFIVDGFKSWQKCAWIYVEFETLKST